MNNRARRRICVFSICLGIIMLITISIEGFDKPLFIQILNIIMITLAFFNIVVGWALLRARVTPYKRATPYKEEQTNKCITTPKRRKKDTDSYDECEAREQRYRRWRVVMAASLQVCILSIIAVCLTDYTSSLALAIFFISCLSFWVPFCQLLDISASSPWW